MKIEFVFLRPTFFSEREDGEFYMSYTTVSANTGFSFTKGVDFRDRRYIALGVQFLGFGLNVIITKRK